MLPLDPCILGLFLVGSAFTASSIQDLVTSQALIGRATERELASLDNLEAVSRQAERASAELDVRRADVIANQESAAVVVEDISELQKQQASRLSSDASSLSVALPTRDREVTRSWILEAVNAEPTRFLCPEV